MHVENDMNLHILGIFEGLFLLDTVHLILSVFFVSVGKTVSL